MGNGVTNNSPSYDTYFASTNTSQPGIGRHRLTGVQGDAIQESAMAILIPITSGPHCQCQIIRHVDATTSYFRTSVRRTASITQG